MLNGVPAAHNGQSCPSDQSLDLAAAVLTTQTQYYQCDNPASIGFAEAARESRNPKPSQLKSAEYENPLNSSCIAWLSTLCTGVNTGVTLVNSVSKLLVSVALVMVGIKGAGTLL